MSALRKILSRVFPTTPNDPVEAYLAQASDLFDVERRLRELDRAGRSPQFWG